MTEKTLLHVEGMTCANCANTITRTLQKEGLKDVNVNYLTTEVTFEDVEPARLEKIKSQINGIGYHVADEHKTAQLHPSSHAQQITEGTSSVEKKFWWSVAFTAPLLLHMVLPFGFLHQPLVQLFLCIPVMAIGISYFGKSAWGSVKSGAPNMDVLIFIGSSAAFIYSVIGMYLYANTATVHQYLFFETAAAIICFVLLGNVLEHRSVKQTTSALHELSKLQPQMAKKVSQNGFDEIHLNDIAKGDKLFVGTGDKVPVDGAIVDGQATLNEAMITGESMPVTKGKEDKVVGGTIVESGSVTMIAERVGEETTLAKIIRMVKDAQLSKPQIQRLGDKVSNIFVPAVLIISVFTFLISHLAFNISFRESMMRSIAVLVISCPCAMGLATPAALMVGIGRAARNGILIKGGSTVEQFSKVKVIVFDKTGTLTTGNFKIKKITPVDSADDSIGEKEIKKLLYSLEQHSSHPIAKAIVKECSAYQKEAAELKWESVTEDKGIGINGTDMEGNLISAGSYVMAQHTTTDDSHNIYLLKNNKLIATVDLEDEIKAGAKETIAQLKKFGIKPVLLSGDRKKICEAVAVQIGIDEVYSEQLPKQKLDLIEHLKNSTEKRNKKQATRNIIAMVGDGINDAPALAKADVGVSLSDATSVAIQSAQIVLLKSHQLNSILEAYSLSRHTLLTIKQNLFWAFFYNILAIPVAAAGYLSPAIGALSMAFSDVVLLGNSIRLRFKKI